MNLEQVHAQIDVWVSAGIDAILIDAAVAGDFGGTGKQVDWAGFSALKSPVPKILASGVELSAGRKDARKTQQFSALATQAFA
jgi:phosphoribosylanthranilate isomerase